MTKDLTHEITAHLPYLRRYARAMTGCRERGDALAEAALTALFADKRVFDDGLAPKIVLFRELQDRCGGISPIFSEDATEAEIRAQRHLSQLTPGSREALLLKAVENFDEDQIAAIMRTRPEHVTDLVHTARLDIARAIAGRLLVIEDETAIAADIGHIVKGMGHVVIGSAPSADEAVEIARAEEPDLILSDIRLNGGGSGIDAVARIQGDCPQTPVIFITAFPEELLTGAGPEPAFLIEKPYSVEQVRSAVSQAMFFAPPRRTRN